MISNNLSNRDQNSIQAPTTFDDSIASLCWTSSTTSPQMLACTSWDSQVAVYGGFENYSGLASLQQFSPIFQIMLASGEYPYLCAGWIEGGSNSTSLLLGGIDGSVCRRDLNAERTITIGKHYDAVKGIYYIESLQFIWTISYDKTMKFWDVRSPDHSWSYNLQAKPVCANMVSDTAVVGFNNEKLLILEWRQFNNLSRNLQDHYIESPLGPNAPLSCISVTKEKMIGVGSYDGRSNLSNFHQNYDGRHKLDDILTFKAHGSDPGQHGNMSPLKTMYPVHAVELHPTDKRTYLTAGGDGDIFFWDFVKKIKLKTLSSRPIPVTAAKMSSDWKFLAYGVGYDWAKGIEGHQSVHSKLHFRYMSPNE